MKRLLVFFCLISNTFFAQEKQRILIIPLNQKTVAFDGTVRKMLKYNEIEVDSASEYIQTLVLSRFQLAFNDFSNDSLDDAEFSFNPFRNIPTLKRKYQFERIIESKESFAKLLETSYYKYVIFFNQFEAVTKKPFSRKTSIRFYFEVYDTNFERKATDFTEFELRISKKMFYSAFQYEFRYSLEKTLQDLIKSL